MHLHFIPKTIDHATILVPQLLTKIPNMYWKVTHIPFPSEEVSGVVEQFFLELL